MSIDKSKKNIGPILYPVFAKNWTKLCEGVNHKKLAEIIGVSETTIYEWKKGYYLPEGKFLIKIKEYFKISIDLLLTGEEVKSEKSAPQIYDSDPMWKHFKEVIEENVKLKEELAEFKKPWDGKTFKRKNSGE